MKTNKLWSIMMMLVVVLGTAIALSSCGSDDDKSKRDDEKHEQEPSTLSIDVSSLNFDADGGSKSISIKSNTGWVITSSSSWVAIEPASGSGNKSIAIKTGENTSTNVRNCDVTIKTDDGVLSKIVKVSQDGSNTILLVNGAKDATLNFGADGSETQSISITANSDWTVTNIPEWIQVSPSNGSGNSTIQVTVNSENFSDANRTSTLSINSNGGHANLNVSQSAKLAKNVRVSMSNLTNMKDGFACDLAFGSATKGYREAFYVDGIETSSFTDRDFYNKLMTEHEYSGKLDWTYLPGWVKPGTTIIYCIAAYGNENNPDGSHKYGPMLIKRITTPQETIYDDLLLSLTYTSVRWSVTTARVGSYGQRCDEYYIWANDGEYADEYYNYANKYTYAYLAHFYMEPMIKADRNDGYKNQPQTILFERRNDKFFMACWGIDRDTKNFSAEMTTIYKNLENDYSNARIRERSNPETWNQKRHVETKAEAAAIRKSMKIYRVTK